MRRTLPLLAILAVFAVEATAAACSGCEEATLAPRLGTEFPANAAGILWRPSYSKLDFSELTLTDLETGMTLPVATHQVALLDTYVYPMEPLEVGRSYRFDVPNDCGDGTQSRTLDAVEPIELPNVGLGTLVASEPVLDSISLATETLCSDDYDAVTVAIELQLDPALEPLAGLLMYETHVDGQRWRPAPGVFDTPPPGASWVGRGEDLIFALCNDGEGGSLDPVVVQMRARIAGFPTLTIDSSEIEIVLDCQLGKGGSDTGDTDTDTDADTDTGADPEGTDSGVDGSGGGASGVVDTDGGEGGTGATGGDGGGVVDVSSGCGCRSSTDRRGGPMALLGLLVLMGLRRRDTSIHHRSVG